MNYQDVLQISYVSILVNLILRTDNKIKNRCCVNRHTYSNDLKQIIKKDNIYYLEVNNDLMYINENMKDEDIKKILNTIIYFEKFKNYPLEGYIKRNLEKNIDEKLLTSLQLQMITNKYYFEN